MKIEPIAAALALAFASATALADAPDGLHAAPSLYWKSGPHRVDLGASVRARSELWDAFANDAELYTGVRTRVRLQYGFDERFLLAGEFQDVRLFGMDPDGTGALALYRNANGGGHHAGGDALRSLYAEARFDGPTFVRVGRQDVKLGQEVLYPEPDWRYLKTARLGERLVGTVGWSHVERAYDGAAGAFERGGVQLYGFAARPTTGVFDAEDGYEHFSDITLGGAVVTVKRGTLLEASELGVFALGYEDDRPLDDGGLADDVEVATFGAHWLGVYPLGPGKLDVLLWGAGQLGDYDGLDHAAAAGIVELGYQLAELPGKPWLRAGLNIASGDGDPADGDHETFFNLLPTNHLYYGFADQLAFQNLTNWFVQLRAAPHPKLALNLFVHWFELTDPDDARYAGTGAFSKSSFGFPAQPSNGLSHVGVEYDVVATFTPHKSTTVELGYAYLDGGAMFRSSAARDLHFFYASLEVRY